MLYNSFTRGVSRIRDRQMVLSSQHPRNHSGLSMTTPPRILVADDDPALCMLLRETLQDAGFSVLTANDGDQLVRMAQDHVPDLLLVDLMMPLMDGFEAIRQLRNDTRTAHLPMIILTARSASSEVVTGFESGADDYIVKPYDIDVLLARIRSHLRRAAQRPVRNPLTGLPGNVLLQTELERRMSNQQLFALLYIDLDNFKAFNDAYGFARGDRAIHMLASVLSEVSPRDDFLGHIGGDDFAIVHFGGDPEDLCQQIITRFDARVPELYDAVDLERGFLRAMDRHGTTRQFGLLSLSISVVTSQGQQFASVDEISKVAAELKGEAKQLSGSSYVIDRRREPSRPQHSERRGTRRPVALLIHPQEGIRAAIATVLRLQGYRPLIAADATAAHGLLARTPNPVLLLADPTIPAIWMIWRQFSTPTPLITIAPDQATADASLAQGATGAVWLTGQLEELTDQLLLHLPRPDVSEPLPPTDQSAIIRQLQARNRELERAANEDAPTGLFNRRYFDSAYPALVLVAQQRHQPIAVVMGDIDRFKQTNDRFGHLLGNDVLKQVAEHLQAAVRPGDLVARYGGEEFVLVLPDCPLPQAQALAEQLRISIATYAWSELHPDLQITISFGVALGPLSTPAELLEEADRRLYAAKAAGRNRVWAEETPLSRV
jgi:diguanylate cyclase (GGDEF)-like protein